MNLLPASVRIVIHVELEPLRKFEMYELMRDAMLKEADPDRDYSATLRRLRACNLDPDEATSFTMGIDDGDHTVGVIKGPGFGKFANFECFEKQLRTDGKDIKFSIEQGIGEKYVEGRDDGDRIYMLNDDAILLADKEVVEEALEVRGGGDNVTTGALAKRLEAVDQKKHAWFVAGRGSKTQPFGYGAMGDAEAMSGTMDLSDGDMAWAWTIEGKDTSSATAIETEINRVVTSDLKSMGSMFGLPTGFETKIKTEREDAQVTVSMELTGKEVDNISSAMRGLFSM